MPFHAFVSMQRLLRTLYGSGFQCGIVCLMSKHFREYQEDAVSQTKQDLGRSSLDSRASVSIIFFLSSSLIDTKMWWSYWKKREPIFLVMKWKALEPSFAGDTDTIPHSSIHAGLTSHSRLPWGFRMFPNHITCIQQIQCMPGIWGLKQRVTHFYLFHNSSV